MDKYDAAPFVATGGLAFSLTLADVNQLVSLCIGLATLGFMIDTWVEKRRKRNLPGSRRRR